MQRWIGVVWLMVMCTACGPHRPAPPSAQFVTWSHQAASPRRMCVLPFTNETDQPDVGSQVRRSFAGHLSVKRFRDVELHEIDTKLPADWRQLPAQSLGETPGLSRPSVRTRLPGLGDCIWACTPRLPWTAGFC